MPWSDPKPIITRDVSIYGLHTNTIRSVITNPIRSCSGSYCYASCIQRAEPWMRGTTEKYYKLCGAYYVHRKYPWHGAKRTCGWLTPRSYIWYAWWRRNKSSFLPVLLHPLCVIDRSICLSLTPTWNRSNHTNRCLVATPTPLHQNWQTSHLIHDPYTSTSRSLCLCRSVELMPNIWPFNWRYLCHSLLCRIVSFSNLLQAAGCLWTQHPLKKSSSRLQLQNRSWQAETAEQSQAGRWQEWTLPLPDPQPKARVPERTRVFAECHRPGDPHLPGSAQSPRPATLHKAYLPPDYHTLVDSFVSKGPR